MAREKMQRQLKESGRLRARAAATRVAPVEEVFQPAAFAVPDAGIEGAQASMFRRTLEAANDAMPLLDKLQVPGAEKNPQDVAKLKAVIRSEFAEMIGELALGAGPRAVRVEQIFSLLLDQLRELQDGIEDDENLNRFHVLADYVASLFRSWNNMQQVFGTQTGIVLQQFGLVCDAADEVRFLMERVGAGTEERQRMPIRSVVSIEDLLAWVQDFASSEGPDVIEEGGGFALRNSVLPITKKIRALVAEHMTERNAANLPKGRGAPSMRRAMKSLEARLEELAWNCQ